MKKSDFTGFGYVFKFTLRQTLKQKSFIIAFTILLGVAAAAFPVMAIIQNSGISSADSSSVENLYVINETNIPELPVELKNKDINVTDMFEDQDYSEDDIDSFYNKVDEENENAVILRAKMDLESGGYIFDMYYPENSKVSEDDVYSLGTEIENWFSEYKVKILNIDKDTLMKVTAGVTTEVMDIEKFSKTDEVKAISLTQYSVIYVMLILFYMIIVMSASLVANKVVEEKANRIVEYLMTTVRPMALMFGKIMAMLVATVGQVLIISAVAVLSKKLTDTVIGSGVSSGGKSVIPFEVLTGLDVKGYAACIVILIIGMIMYGMLAALFAASVSRMEDLQQGMKVYSMVILISFFMSFAAANTMMGAGVNGFVNFCAYFPLTSVMVLPGMIIIGKAGLAMVAISVIVMVIFAILLLRFVASVYENVIVMNGNPIGVKEMLTMARYAFIRKEAAGNEK